MYKMVKKKSNRKFWSGGNLKCEDGCGHSQDGNSQDRDRIRDPAFDRHAEADAFGAGLEGCIAFGPHDDGEDKSGGG